MICIELAKNFQCKKLDLNVCRVECYLSKGCFALSSYFLHLLWPCPQTIHKRVRIRTAHGGEDWLPDPGSHPSLWPTDHRPLGKSLCAAGFCQLSTVISLPLLPNVSQGTSASIWKIPIIPVPFYLHYTIVDISELMSMKGFDFPMKVLKIYQML